MKKPLLFFAFLSFQAAVLYSQTFTGTWQGALKVPQARNGELRTVIRISMTEADKLAAVFYSIDLDPTRLNASTVTVNGSTLKISFRQLNGSYEGRISPDGKTIDGTWSQGAPIPLTLTRAEVGTAWTIPDPPPPPQIMDPKAAPEFEVATIKPSNPDQPGLSITMNRSRTFLTRNTTLADLVKWAFDVHPKQVVGAPAWFDTARFDITAKPDKPGLATLKQMQAMVRKLLADRFALSFQKEKRDDGLYRYGGQRWRKDPEGRGRANFGSGIWRDWGTTTRRPCSKCDDA